MIIGQTLLKRYKIIENISNGAFGHTYKAIDAAFPGKPLRLVKHLSPLNENPQALKIAKRLFETEANVLSNLGKQDSIPTLYAYFEEYGEFYLVQELIEGHTLSREFQSGQRWSEEKTVEFLQELLEILSVVHQHNTIHRDIKPANIMRREHDGKLFLIDFGAVKEILTVDKHGKTDETIMIGTSPYMSPEQAMGRPQKCSDVYAVSILGIQALTGLPSNELPQDSEQLEQTWKNLDIQINPQLKYVLGKMVSFQYKKRYANADEALKALVPTLIKPLETKIKYQNKLLRLFLGLMGLFSATFVGWRVFNQPDYQQLETYLQNQEWEQANRETDKLILKVAGEKSALNVESSNKLSCKALEKIDNLWTKNSKEKFGFTPQKKVYLETDNQFNEYIESTYEAFGNQIGWRIFGAWKRYEDFNFEQINLEITPLGHFPLPGKVAENKQDLRIREPEMLLSRFNDCGL